MSQYRYTSGEKDVLTGWDPPLQYFFLVITDINDDETVFSNLDLDDPVMTIDSICRKK